MRRSWIIYNSLLFNASQLEDDIQVVPGFLPTVRSYIENRIVGTPWVMVAFSKLGFIGKFLYYIGCMHILCVHYMDISGYGTGSHNAKGFTNLGMATASSSRLLVCIFGLFGLSCVLVGSTGLRSCGSTGLQVRGGASLPCRQAVSTGA